MEKEEKAESACHDEKSIGIIGGIGPFAGIDLMSKILLQTLIQTVLIYTKWVSAKALIIESNPSKLKS